MDKEQAKEKIKKLVERYKRLSEVEKKRYNEQQTKDHFIRPLFEALGWNFEEDVWPETDVSGKRVDYAFKADGITKFFIEAKKVSINLDEEKWAKQAIDYSWHKSVPWVILTDFEAIKIFNTEWDTPDIQSCQFIEISWTEYLTSEKLWWLSPDAFKKGVLDKEADKVGRRPKKIIDEQLAKDLIRWRDLLRKDLEGYNLKIDKQKIAEYVQKILDRLIFIRTLEDRKIEDVILQPLAREWEEKEGIKANKLLSALNKTFRRIDKTYNSGLFAEGACDYLGDKIDADDNTFVEIINELYKTRDKGIRYNFADIPADIFGGIYEQYLGYIQKEDLKQKKTSKRKSQGIYYTPRYIVDYIVQNTLGEVLKNKTPNEIRNLKILDPACGSGSFLITAYQSLIDYWQKQDRKRFKQDSDKLRKIEQVYKKQNGNLISSQEKMRILLNNIYGVDLDKEAVELAKLNLLMKMVGSKIKLPKLGSNIQEGNSLISGSEKELKKYFGRGWKNKKAFEWEEKFSFCHSRGGGNPEDGFDIVIGNPPYIKEYVEKLAFDGLHSSLYYQGKMDIWTMFACIAIDLLKDGGYFSFIAPNKWITNEGASIFRDKILREGELIKFVDFGDYKVFQDAGIQTMIFIFRKCKARKKYKIKYSKIIDKNMEEENLIKFLKSNCQLQLSEIESFDAIVEPQKFAGKNIAFIHSKKDDILNKIKSRKNFDLTSKEVGQGIVAAPDKYFLVKNLNSFNVKEKEFIKKFYTSSEKFNSGLSKNYIFYISDKNFKGEKLNNFPNIKNHFKPFESILKKAKIKYGTPEKPYFYLHRERDEKFFKEGPKIVCGVRVLNPSFYYTEDKYYGSRALNFIKTNRVDLKYLTGLLNSKLIYFWLKNKGKQLGDLLQIDKGPLLQIPIFVSENKSKQNEIIKLVNKITKLNKELQKLDPMLDEVEYKEIKEKIKKTDEEIDERVFELYGMGEEERKIIEQNF
jgi:adenine-specific DNA-methyltransferase